MQVTFSPKAQNDFEFWLKNKKSMASKIVQLIENIKENPHKGIGKPEPLKHKLTGFWSRRITQEHRLIYQVEENTIYILSAKGHYN